MLDLQADAAKLDGLSPAIVAAAWAIVDREGGYNDVPGDAGGATNCGISLRYAQGQGLAFDLNGDGVVNAEDIHLVTPAIAAAAFLIDFFANPGLDLLPVGLQANAFDASVNMGQTTACKLAQSCFNALRATHPQLARIPVLAVDGALGAHSVTALHQAEDLLGDAALNNAYCDARDAHYHDIVARNPADAKFLKGWLSRNNSFRQE